MNNPRQATRGVPVGPNVSFKSTKQIYRPVSNKNGASTSSKKMLDEVSRQEVSNSNTFDALNLIENNDDLGTNVGNSKSAGKGSLYVAHDSSRNTPIIDKIDKLKCQILDGKLMFVDDDENPLVPTGGSDRGYGTNSLLEQWRETKWDDDYDPYDNDLYERHDMSDHLQAICDDLDITVRGMDFKRWKKKMHFSLISINVVYVLSIPIPDDGGDDATLKQNKKRSKWENDDYVYRDLILNEIYVEDASSKKFLGSNFNNYKMVDSRPVMEQYNKLLRDELTFVELGSHFRTEESLRTQENDKPKRKNVAHSSVFYMVEHSNSSRYNDNKGKRKYHDNTKADPSKESILTC
ncbi:hypothetical protein Tco_0829101 [Tanacetum coccineum]